MRSLRRIQALAEIYLVRGFQNLPGIRPVRMSRGGWTAGCRPTATGILILLCTLTGSALQAQSLEQCLQFKSFAESEKEPRPEQLLNQSFKPMDRLEQLGFHRGPVWLRCSFKDLDPFPASGRHRLLLANGFIQYVDVYLYKIQGNAAERIARFRAGSSVHSDLHRVPVVLAADEVRGDARADEHQQAHHDASDDAGVKAEDLGRDRRRR